MPLASNDKVNMLSNIIPQQSQSTIFWYTCTCNVLATACPKFPYMSVCAGHEPELTPPAEACISAQWAAPESASDGLQQPPSKENIVKGRGMPSVTKGWLA